ncbi:MAG: L-serine ammonia-lyase, iron-sulfur-dependent, subunit alpha [Candidatus Sericytochromatia bacterium]|nr:L-serine ammonia-lyase, iron-sulfur-dependent, subunit alpha [Candidatus Sericytochromatia bacterium]
MQPTYRFDTMADLVALAEGNGITLAEVALRHEVALGHHDREVILVAMRERWATMRRSMEMGLEAPQRTMGGLSHGAGQVMSGHRPVLVDQTAAGVMARALAVNECSAAMRRIVAAPTAGSSGILPAALWGAQQRLGCDDEAVVMALFTAAALGMVIANRATISGAQAGCMAEVGVSAAMAAGAMAEMAGASPDAAIQAMALALKNTLGLVCDPIGGYVEVPCIKRNAIFAIHATTAAEMALAGIRSFVPADQVISAMKEIGEAMPKKLKETSQGGLATTLIGLEVMAKRPRVDHGQG